MFRDCGKLLHVEFDEVHFLQRSKDMKNWKMKLSNTL